MIWIIISIALLVNLILYPLWLDAWVDLFGKNVEYQSYKGMKVILVDNLPFGNGIYLGFLHTAIIKRLYYTNNGILTNTVCYTVTKVQFDAGYRGTTDIIEHEQGHDDELDRYQQKAGKIFGYLGWLIWFVANYSELLFITHNNLPIEREAEKDETFTNN